MPRLAVLLTLAAVLGACGSAAERPEPEPGLAGAAAARPADPGLARYRAYVAAEAASLAERVAARRFDDARVHAGRLAPVARATGALELLAVARKVDGPRAATLRRAALRTVRDAPRTPLTSAAVLRAAAVSLEDARGSGDRLDVEARVDGAAVAFDAIRDAVWAVDQGLVGSIDERLARVRDELRRDAPDQRRLSARLRALAWRLALAPARASGARVAS